MTATVTNIHPEIPKAEITRWRCLLDTNGKREIRTWASLFDEFSRVCAFRGEDHPGWSAAIFDEDKREKDRVLRVTAAVLDYDNTATIDDALTVWTGTLGFLHTSKKHTDEAHRFRIVLPLKRSVSVFEWELLWAKLNEHAGELLDGQAKDASRFWWTPGAMPESAFEARLLEGAVLDPDVWLRKPEKPKPEAKREPAQHRTWNYNPPSAERRAIAYIRKMPTAIAGARGHDATFRVAIELARGFALSEETTFRILRDEYNPLCQPPWSEKELAHKAEQASKRARVPLGYRLENDRSNEWQAPAEYFENEPDDSYDASEQADTEPPPAEETDSEQPKPALSDPALSMAELLGAVLDNAKTEREAMGVRTGHFRLDHMLAGFRPQRITVLGARTSFGKSSYAIMVTDEALKRGERVLLISAEDSSDTYGQRFMARRARVNAYKLRINKCDQVDIKRMSDQVRTAEQFKFFVDAVGKPAEWIAKTIRERSRAEPFKLVIVDYMQRIKAARHMQDRRNEVTYVTALISDAIKETGASGLLLSQIKRLEKGGDSEPEIFDLKESGDIENMAEHILLGWVEEICDESGNVVGRKRWMKIGKNKDGPLADEPIELPFVDATASFKVVDGEVYERDSMYDEFDGIADNDP